MTRHFAFRALFTVMALGVLGAYIFGPKVWAERFDTMALALLGLAALPWLGALVEEFKVGGVEAKLRAIREETAEAADAAAQAREVAEEMVLQGGRGGLAASPSPAPDVTGPEGEEVVDEDPFAVAQSGPLEALEQLGRRYVETRAVMSSGSVRTARMTSLFADMQSAARELGGDAKSVQAWMFSDDPGQQLAAVAWLREFPAAQPPAAYIWIIEGATQPFLQYWALRALSGRIDALGIQDFSISDRVALKKFESLMRAGTDRHAQIRRINRRLTGRRAD